MGYGHEVGVNPEDAFGRGGDAADYAAGFRDLIEDFRDAIQEAMDGSGTSPGISRAAWRTFYQGQCDVMETVRDHGIRLGENVQSGGARAASTDSDSAEEYAVARGSLLHRDVNGPL